MGDNVDLLDVEEELHSLVLYFEKTERRLEEHSGQPVHLTETQSARRAHIAVGRLVNAERERTSAWKHLEPSPDAQAFINFAAAFIKERGLTWEELAEELFLEPRAFGRLAYFAPEDDD